MKKIMTLAATALIAAAAFAQQKADIIVSYDCSAKDWRSDTTNVTKMTLLANSKEAKFFNDISLWNDSLSSTPEGAKKLREILMAACVIRTPDGGVVVDMRKGPTKKIHTYVFTNAPTETLRYYSKLGDEQVYYDEPLGEQTWEIGDSTATIMGYECISAETEYHGRKWKAWFTPEIPVPFGPWKLHGLPGLILKAEADNGNGYVATGLEETDRTMTPMYSPENYDKTDRKKALANHEHFLNNIASVARAKFGSSVRVNPESKAATKYDAEKYSNEPDYKTGEK